MWKDILFYRSGTVDDMKKCRRCNLLKTLVMFRLNKSKMGVKRYYFLCLDCEREYKHERYMVLSNRVNSVIAK